MTLFHGTSAKAAKSIRAQGLKASKTKSEPGVYATPKHELALTYAATAALNTKSRTPLNERLLAVVEVKDHGFTQRSAGSVGGLPFDQISANPHDVPAHHIVGIKMYRYGDVVKDGKVIGGASPVKVIGHEGAAGLNAAQAGAQSVSGHGDDRWARDENGRFASK